MASRPTSPVQGVLFDLDGTLLDTAPDLIVAVNQALAGVGLPEQPSKRLQPLISHGVAAMLRTVIPIEESAILDAALASALAFYGNNLARQTHPFEGIPAVLDELDRRGIPWGIVTNKLTRFTDPLVAAFGLNERARAVISGDTTARRKPDPLPLNEACRRIGQPAAACVYVGDARSDIEAGQRAEMMTLAATYGYLTADDRPDAWGADGTLSTPTELLGWLRPRLIAQLS
ncbi:HAD family hydrolase [Methylotetracoccus oryzae]|uniref:HAD family hydrolase n=1 Tax=Methylotetracoccus oryzae TaxID=1919059 RepID=UPI001119DCE5|nr:HAD-IA family hydrolase [Methylotetracoccus oryzae]